MRDKKGKTGRSKSLTHWVERRSRQHPSVFQVILKSDVLTPLTCTCLSLCLFCALTAFVVGDTVVMGSWNLLRSQDVVYTHLTNNVWNEILWKTLWVYTAFWHCCNHRSPCLQCHVCPFLKFSDLRTDSAYVASCNPISFPFWTCALYSSLDWFRSLAACCFTNIKVKELSFPISSRFLLPPSGSFPTLCFISIHGDLHVHITCLETRLSLQIRFFISVCWKFKDLVHTHTLVKPMQISSGSFQISVG